MVSLKISLSYARTGKASEGAQTALVSSSLEEFSSFELEIDPDRDLGEQLNAFLERPQNALAVGPATSF